MRLNGNLYSTIYQLVDASTYNNRTSSNKKKNQLNLDPKDIKKINRPSKGKLPIDELIEKQNTKPLKKKKTVKYIKPSEIKTKKKPIISIEKVRK